MGIHQEPGQAGELQATRRPFFHGTPGWL